MSVCARQNVDALHGDIGPLRLQDSREQTVSASNV
jgi:hypothetical protein